GNGRTLLGGGTVGSGPRLLNAVHRTSPVPTRSGKPSPSISPVARSWLEGTGIRKASLNPPPAFPSETLTQFPAQAPITSWRPSLLKSPEIVYTVALALLKSVPA